MSSKSNKGIKLSLGEFMGPAAAANTSSLPKGPAQRAPDDDGAFKRPVRRSDNYNDEPPSRSEGDGNWRRGGGNSGAPSSNFGPNSSSDNFNEQAPSRSEGDGNWRRGGFGGTSGNNRDSYMSNRSGGGFDDDRGAGGYNRDSGSDSRSGTTNNWRGGGVSRENSNPTTPLTGERPRLQLKTRTVPTTEPTSEKNDSVRPSDAPTKDSKSNPFGSAVAVEISSKSNEIDTISSAAPSELNTANDDELSKSKSVPTENITISESQGAEATTKVVDETSATKSSMAQPDKREKVKREPEIINSRAAAFGATTNSGATKSESTSDRREKQGPPPVLNARFEKLAEEERERKSEREMTSRRDRIHDDDEGPPPVINSRFTAAAEADRSYTKSADRGPPPVANSRFAAAAEADRSYSRPDDRGPPPVANSRFAAAADADRSSMNHSRDNYDGPPPTVNSRFAAAAEADGRSAFVRDDRGPPPVTNSRFAAAAALAEDEKMEFEDRRRERESFYNRDDQKQSRGAIPQNSRFAAAAAADSDYTDRESREQSSSRFGDRGDDNYRRSGQNDRNRGGHFPGAGNRHDVVHNEPPPPPQMTRVDELLKPKKQDDAQIVPLTKEHEANILKIPEKAFKREEETFLTPPVKKVEKPAVSMEEPIPKVQVISAESIDTLLSEFSSGEKLGDELKAWCTINKPLPPIEKLLFHMLKTQEKLNPDPNCGWAEQSKYGAALLYLIEENLYNQMQILWAIQMYCETLGFPKLDGESVVQSMFRAMYKYDLAEADSFIEWKEDESDAHDKGKMTAIIQTMDWFNWLEADEDDDEGDNDEDGME